MRARQGDKREKSGPRPALSVHPRSEGSEVEVHTDVCAVVFAQNVGVNHTGSNRSTTTQIICDAQTEGLVLSRRNVIQGLDLDAAPERGHGVRVEGVVARDAVLGNLEVVARAFAILGLQREAAPGCAATQDPVVDGIVEFALCIVGIRRKRIVGGAVKPVRACRILDRAFLSVRAKVGQNTRDIDGFVADTERVIVNRVLCTNAIGMVDNRIGNLVVPDIDALIIVDVESVRTDPDAAGVADREIEARGAGVVLIQSCRQSEGAQFLVRVEVAVALLQIEGFVEVAQTGVADARTRESKRKPASDVRLASPFTMTMLSLRIDLS